MRFISHLDMTRFMARMLRKAELPVWYTEGFHPHLYLTFALPLSLGFESDYEAMDFRLEDDNYPVEDICYNLNKVFPEGIYAFRAAEPVNKSGKIAYAEFNILFSDSGAVAEPLQSFFNNEEIIYTKLTKRGNEKKANIAPKIEKVKIFCDKGNTALSIMLPAGGEDNINPELLINTFYSNAGMEKHYYKITRTALLTGEHKLFE